MDQKELYNIEVERFYKELKDAPILCAYDPKFKENINFNIASRYWKRNKIFRKEIGMKNIVKEYCCGEIKQNKCFCRAPPYQWNKQLYPKPPNWPRFWSMCKTHIDKTK